MRTSLEQGNTISLNIVLKQSYTSSPKSSTRVPKKMNDLVSKITGFVLYKKHVMSKSKWHYLEWGQA